jgi:NAD/NADP transhydrogenase beta subunit
VLVAESKVQDDIVNPGAEDDPTSPIVGIDNRLF